MALPGAAATLPASAWEHAATARGLEPAKQADEGLALFVARFQPEFPQQAISQILLGLGYFDDVDPDDALPVPRGRIVDYRTRRQPEIVAARGRLPGQRRQPAMNLLSWLLRP